MPLTFSPDVLLQEHIADIRLAAAKMSGPQHRDFMAEMSLKYCTGNARLTERVFGWSRILAIFSSLISVITHGLFQISIAETAKAQVI